MDEQKNEMIDELDVWCAHRSSHTRFPMKALRLPMPDAKHDQDLW